MKQKLLQHKTRFVAFVVASVDGRISLTSKTVPRWTSKEDWQFFQDNLARVDAVVVGRNTYAAASTRLRKRNTFVLTSRPATLRRRGSVTFVNPSHVDLADLLAKYKTVAVVGGGMVYSAMLRNKLLDELYVTIEPLILGRGKEMFSGSAPMTTLNLVSVRRLNRKGTIVLHYKIDHQK